MAPFETGHFTLIGGRRRCHRLGVIAREPSHIRPVTCRDARPVQPQHITAGGQIPSNPVPEFSDLSQVASVGTASED
jgi:hypothetical protein